MLNTIYQLARPRQFEIAFEDISLDSEHVLVRPTHLSICNADQRYYQGKRPEEILRQKLPMALIHEGIGRVVYDPTGTFEKNERVVMIPNTPVEQDEIIAENYLRSSKFRGSSMNGFLQEYVQTVPERLLKVPEGISDQTAAFTEMVSVCYGALRRFDRNAHSRRTTIGIWGDGNMGYITALLVHSFYPQAKVYAFGVSENKLSDFSFVEDTFLVTQIPADIQLDHAFECVGGRGSQSAINQIIDTIHPEGTIGILGVSEDPVPINTRMVLEKGLHILGTSRSSREDFKGLLRLYEEQPQLPEYLEKLVGGVIPVRELKDIDRAFEMDIHKEMGKTILVF